MIIAPSATAASTTTATAIASPERNARAADIGMSLFLASLVMFFGSLFSGYVLLRAGSEAWDSPWLRVQPMTILIPSHWMHFIMLVAAAANMRRYRLGYHRPGFDSARSWLPLNAVLIGSIVAQSILRAGLKLRSAGYGPASSVSTGAWFVLMGTVALLVIAGGVATAWVGWRHRDGRAPESVGRGLERYWWLMAAFQLALVIGLYLV